MLQKKWFSEGRPHAWYYAAWSRSGRRSSVHHLLLLIEHVLEQIRKNIVSSSTVKRKNIQCR
jgi:hypothetical protein